MKRKKITKTRVFDPRYLVFDFGRLTAVPLGLLWLRPKWIYENAAAKKRIRGGALLMFNHTGFIDPILDQFAVWYRRQHFVAATELFTDGFRGWLFRQFHCIEVDRRNFNLSTFRDVTDHLAAGNVVSIYPEGRINTGEKDGVSVFKSGMVMMALRSGVPVVPIFVRPPRRFWNRARFVIGEPVDLRAEYGALPSVDTVERISADLREKELRLAAFAGKTFWKKFSRGPFKNF